MRFTEFAPSPFAASIVDAYWTLESDCASPPDAGPVTPDGCVEIVVDRNRVGASFVFGLTTSPRCFEYDRRIRLFGIRPGSPGCAICNLGARFFFNQSILHIRFAKLGHPQADNDKDMLGAS